MFIKRRVKCLLCHRQFSNRDGDMRLLTIAPDKRGFPHNISPQKLVVGSHLKGLSKALLMNTNNMFW